jgi:hypothetical protein
LDTKELSLSVLTQVGFHIGENKKQPIFYAGEGAIFIGAVGSMLTNLTFQGKAGDIGFETNPDQRAQGSEFVYRVAGESQKSTSSLNQFEIA